MIFLALLLFVVLLLTYYIIVSDYLNPGTGVILSFVVAILCASINANLWKQYLSAESLLILFSGVLLYAAITLILTRRTGKVEEARRDTITRIDVLPVTIIVASLIVILSCIYYYKDVHYIASLDNHGGSWGDAISYFRDGSMTGEVEIGISSRASNLFIISTAIAYGFSYLFTNNRLSTKKSYRDFFLLVPIGLFMVNTVFTGGRLPILRLLIGWIVLYLLMLSKRNGSFPINFRKTGIFLLASGAILYAFFALNSVFGRDYQGGALYYLTSYIGGSIPLFDMFLHSPIHHSVWGYETFPSILKWIGRLTNNSTFSNILVNKEFRSGNGYVIGNVYTAFRAWISDFGFPGMYILTVIHATIFGLVYRLVVHTRLLHKKLNIALLVYMYSVHAIYLFAIDDRLFMDLFSLTTVKIFILFIIFDKIISIQQSSRKLFHSVDIDVGHNYDGR